LWRIYPKWPAGRSKKKPSADAFARAKKQLGFTADDIAYIERDILARLRDCATWEKNDKFGPVMFATYMNQRLWNETYQKAQKHWTQVERPRPPVEERNEPRPDPETVRQMIQAAFKGVMH